MSVLKAGQGFLHQILRPNSGAQGREATALLLRTRELRHALVAIAFVTQVAHHAAAAEPLAPCGSDPYPAYAPPGPLPALALWQAGELPAGWVPPACTGWAPRGDGVVFAAAGRFKHDGSSDALLARAGAFSRQTEIRRWNVKTGRWEQQYKASAALTGPDPGSRRPDFQPAEFVKGARLYFVQDDMEALGPIVHELTVRERSAERIVLTTRNVNKGRAYFLPVIDPGGLEGFFMVEREAGSIWRYYSLTRVHLLIPDAMAPPPKDHLNKAVALFRFLAGMPTDTEPPAAR
jgi:hypothetical protein